MSELYERVAVLPTPTEELKDTIYKYAGSTTDNYTRGKYYKCVSTSEVVSNSQGKFVSTTWTNDKGTVVSYVDSGKDDTIKVNNVSAPKSGVLNVGDVLYASHSSFANYNILFTWYKWEEVEIDEHDKKKKFSQANWTYLFSEYAQRFNEEV